ncbi:MAG TPA: hypothetical protein VFR39_01825, partial [Burkholderiales bacterium]|nr:hypothetical protein [Burkholderiales bacterium]
MTGSVFSRVFVAWAILALFPAHALAQGAKPGVFADEDKDWGVPPTSVLRSVGYHSPTPMRIQGGRVITTGELK